MHARGVQGSGHEAEGGGEPEEGFALSFWFGVFVEPGSVIAVGRRVEGRGCSCDALGECVVDDLEEDVRGQRGEGERGAGGPGSSVGVRGRREGHDDFLVDDHGL